MQQRRPSLKLLAQLPTILRGLNYSRKWEPPAAGHPSPALSGPPASSAPSNPLKSYFDCHKEGRGIRKWIHYFDIYHRHFRKFVGQNVRILEIGIHSGGSLEMWRDYFGPACRVYGVDKQEECKAYENEYTTVFTGDQADREFWKSFKDKVPAIDIVIDDGGHQPEQQIVTFEEMLPHLSPGGVYLCEDIHGVHRGFSAYSHGLVKSLNDMAGRSGSRVRPSQFQSWIRSIHFYPSVMVLEKAERPEEQFIDARHGTEWQPFPRPRKEGS